jgi:catechol 2,3-dioxygenase-like lactoylglutathione lyase family enzyme
MSKPTTAAIAPFFIVSNVTQSLAFYCDRLGFHATFRDPVDAPFFAVLLRDGAQLLLKSQAGIAAVPNCRRHPQLRWDAYVDAPDPDGLAAEFAGRGVTFARPLQDTSDGLRGFELIDPDGYVLFFGRPR